MLRAAHPPTHHSGTFPPQPMVNPMRIRTLAAAGTLAVLSLSARAAGAQTTPETAPLDSAVAATPAAAPAPAEQPRQERRRPRRRREVITADELAESGAMNLFDAVQRLRPEWLRAGGARSFGNGSGSYTDVVVYQNNAQMGGLDALRQMGVEMAQSLRYLDGTSASNTLPGLGSRIVSGAIIVETVARRR